MKSISSNTVRKVAGYYPHILTDSRSISKVIGVERKKVQRAQRLINYIRLNF